MFSPRTLLLMFALCARVLAEDANAGAERTWVPARDISGLRFYRGMPTAIEYSEVRLAHGDDSRWAAPEFDDRSWRVITRNKPPLVPVRSGIMWLRFRIRWNAAEGGLPPGMLLWAFSGSYDLYWDGVALANSGVPGQSREEEKEGTSIRTIAIPPAHAGPGEHLFALRVSTHHAKGPWPTTRLQVVMIAPDVMDATFSRQNILPVMAAGAMLTMTVAALVMWVIAARRRGLLLFAGLCFFSGALVALQWYQLAYSFPYSWRFGLVLGVAASALAINVLLSWVLFAEWNVPRRVGWLCALIAFDAVVVIWKWPALGALSAALLGVSFAFVLATCGWAIWRRKHGARAVAIVVALSSFLLWRDPVHFTGTDFFEDFLPVILGVLLTIALRLRADRRHSHEVALTAARLEIELLKKNMQPHFLMNTLTALAETVEENPARAVKLIDDLAEEFRTVARMASEKTVSLTQELALCRVHLRVMRARTDLNWELDAEGVNPEALVPPALFLTLIENCFSHQRPRAGANTFVLRSRRQLDRIHYLFQSPGTVVEKDRVLGGTGLRYVRARLEESFPGEWALSQREVTAGWETSIEFPATDGNLASHEDSHRRG